MHERARLGMAMFLLSEAVFFFMLIVAFVYFRNASAPDVRSLNLTSAVIYTVCLAASSFTMWRASASAGRKSAAGLRVWLGGTIALGGAFLYGQGSEYARLLARNITIGQGLFGTTFFTLTGFHGLHVLAGMVLLGTVLGLAGDTGERRSVAVRTVAMYWYFVDAVWLAIFSIVYLWTFL